MVALERRIERAHGAAIIRAGVSVRSNPVELPTFRGAALELQASEEPEIIISGPYETGKTFAALWRIDSLLRQYPRSQALMVRKVRNDMDASCIQTYKKIIEKRGGVSCFGGEKPQWFDYGNGSRLWIAGLDNPGKALSAEYDFIYPNQAEQLAQDDWQTLTTRCTGRAGNAPNPQIIGDCNPGPEDHWILKRVASGALKLLRSRHEDNPRLYNDDGSLTPDGVRTMRALDALTGILKRRGRDGEWVGAEGLFFEEWDDELHVCNPFKIPDDWPIWGALDHGFAHNTAFGAFTQNQRDIYLIAEHVKNGWLVPQHCLAIRRQLVRAGIDPRRLKNVVAGHDVFQKRGDSGGKTIAAQYAEARDPETNEPIGLHLTHATLDRIAGARELLELLGNRELGIKPRFRIFRTCPRTIAAMARMVHDPRDAEDVLKVNADQNGEGGDDEYDVARYGVMESAPKISITRQRNYLNG
ncbi:MAG TPA: phage terminase large subunit [Pyrinomonadaceae bacterium]|jgi:hypothetical protein